MEDKTLLQFTSDLASSAPTPGGGGASALAGALASALGSMVGSLTVGKKKYADVEEEIKSLMVRSEELRLKLLQGIEDDAKGFEPLSKAYGLPKDSENRDAFLEQCLQMAANAPYQIMLNTTEVINLLKRYSEIGSKLMISDAATGAMIAHGALYGAAINVKVNTKLMKNREYAENLNQKVESLLSEYGPKALQTYNNVNERMK